MQNEFTRTELLFGSESMRTLADCRVIVFGVGGVGGHVVEGLARSGIGAIDIVDNDRVSVTNINRQIIAAHSTIGRLKTDVVRERLLDINPDLCVTSHTCFFLPETSDRFDFSLYDYVVDAIDTVSGKIEIIMKARGAGVPVISAMGCGNKVNPLDLRVTDIYSTRVCPLAKVMRHELRKRGVTELKVVYSEEPSLTPLFPADETCGSDNICSTMNGDGKAGRPVPGSTAFVPSVAGLIIASEVVKDIIGWNRDDRS